MCRLKVSRGSLPCQRRSKNLNLTKALAAQYTIRIASMPNSTKNLHKRWKRFKRSQILIDSLWPRRLLKSKWKKQIKLTLKLWVRKLQVFKESTVTQASKPQKELRELKLLLQRQILHRSENIRLDILKWMPNFETQSTFLRKRTRVLIGKDY